MASHSTQPADESARSVGPEQLLVICAWCGLELYRPVERALRTSHSICDTCADRVIADNTHRASAPVR